MNRSFLNDIPPVVKNLIIINVLFFIASYILELNGIRLSSYLGLYFPLSENFGLHQIFSHMFMHGGITHIFFNMFALYMFGRVLESVWGPKRFLIYFLITGIGAAILHSFVNFLEYQSLINKMSPEMVEYVKTEGPRLWSEGKNFTDTSAGKLNMLLNIPTVGASGAVFGVLLAFGMLFPNTRLMLLFPPIPIKAKYFVMGYGAIELYLGFSHPGSNIAHFAHLGGMLFGFILIKYWQKHSNKFY